MLGYIVGIVILLLLLFVFATIGRRGHKGLACLEGWSYAHRGLHGCGAPENSLEAFRRAKDAGYGVELDVHLLMDGNLAVIHDSDLKRCTGIDGFIEDLCTNDLQNCYLEGTAETIPTFESFLALYNGAAPIIVELKTYKNNYAKLCEVACNILDHYPGVFCLESFDPRCIFWLRRNRPELIRGQLTQNYLISKSPKAPWILKFLMSNQLFNFLTYPDFVAHSFEDRRTVANLFCRKLWGVKGVSWIIRSQQDYDIAVSEGWIPIFENFLP